MTPSMQDMTDIEQTVKFLRLARLKQYPPATRTILVRVHSSGILCTARFRFPHMSFGGLQWNHTGGKKETGAFAVAYMHSRPWLDLKDAARIIQPIIGFHGGNLGSFCVGDRGYVELCGGRDPADIFWLTRNIIDNVADLQAWWDQATMPGIPANISDSMFLAISKYVRDMERQNYTLSSIGGGENHD